MKDLFELYITFAKIGSITFGGGYAMLPILQREIVENKKWESDEDLLDYFAVWSMYTWNYCFECFNIHWQ